MVTPAASVKENRPAPDDPFPAVMQLSEGGDASPHSFDMRS
jgi:hypothetical protein